jgi:hypothetical protein
LHAHHVRERGPGFRRHDRGGVGDGGLFGQHVFGKRYHDRAGAALRRHADRARDNFGNAGGVGDLDRPFGDGAEELFEVDFLKRLAAAEFARDLADEQQHGRRVLLRHMHARARVRRAGAAGDKTNAGHARELAHGFGHHRRPALLTADDEFVRALVDRIENGEEAFARHAEGTGQSVRDQRIDEDLRAGAGFQ